MSAVPSRVCAEKGAFVHAGHTPGSEQVERGLKCLLRQDGGGDPEAFVLLALRPSGDVTVHTSKRIQPTIQPLMVEWGRLHLRHANESAGWVEDESVDDDVLADRNSKPVDTTKLENHERPTPRCVVPSTALVPMNSRVLRRQEVDTTFEITDEARVVEILRECLAALQQNALKKVAKAWIKAICPRKQARFPYRNEKRIREGGDVEVPLWWPIKTCKFTEPDHILKESRIAFLLHLLRFRPSVHELREWNRDGDERGPPTAYHEENYWTEFLQRAAPLSILDELREDSPAKINWRKKVMEKMYKLAAREEDYKHNRCDPIDMTQSFELEPMELGEAAVGKKRIREECSVGEDLNSLRGSACGKSKKRVVNPKGAPALWNDADKAGRKRSAAGKDEAAAATHVCSPLAEDSAFTPTPLTSDQMINQSVILYDARASSNRSTTINPKALHKLDALERTLTASPTPSLSFGSVRSAGSSMSMTSSMCASMQANNLVEHQQPLFATLPNTPTISPIDSMDLEFPGVPDVAAEARDPDNQSNALAAHPLHFNSKPLIDSMRGDESMFYQQNGAECVASDHLTSSAQWPPTAASQTDRWSAGTHDQNNFLTTFEPNHGLPTLATDYSYPSFLSGEVAPPLFGHHHTEQQQQQQEVPFPYYDKNVCGPHLSTGYSTPANIVRGYTGHSCGVGDTALPPGHGH